MKYLAILSGGLDSTVAAHIPQSEGHECLGCISFDYGQRHAKELDYAVRQANALGVSHQIVDLTAVTQAFTSTSALTSDAPVPKGHYAAETMRQTVVPNRNMIMIAVAAAAAVTLQADAVTVGTHAGDHYIYPDCRPDFMDALNNAIKCGNEGFISATFEIVAPFINATKADIVKAGNALDIDMEQTWSCYEGGEIHCGQCGTCVERQEAFWVAGVQDPTEYMSPITPEEVKASAPW